MEGGQTPLEVAHSLGRSEIAEILNTVQSEDARQETRRIPPTGFPCPDTAGPDPLPVWEHRGRLRHRHAVMT